MPNLSRAELVAWLRELLPDPYAFPVTAGASYGPAIRELEYVSRPLWAIFSLIASGEYDEELVEPFVRRVREGLRPGPRAFPDATTKTRQVVVEMGVYGYGLLACGTRLLDMLSAEERDRLAAWLNAANGVELPWGNWYMFRILINCGLRASGLPYDAEQLAADARAVESMYVGGGWYEDGRPFQRDHYIALTFHFASVLLSRLVPDSGVPCVEHAPERAEAFGEDYLYWFDRQGRSLPFGRSLSYRFGHAALWAAASVARSWDTAGSASGGAGVDRDTAASGVAEDAGVGTGVAGGAGAAAGVAGGVGAAVGVAGGAGVETGAFGFGGPGVGVGVFGGPAVYPFARTSVPTRSVAELKALLMANLSWWRGRPIMEDGRLSVGYGYANALLGEDYTGPGAAGWGFKSFVVLALPSTDPFWRVEPQMPKRETLRPEPACGMIICSGRSHAYALSTMQYSAGGVRQRMSKYGKLCYSTAFGWNISPMAERSSGFGVDSALALGIVGAESLASRSRIDAHEVRDGYAYSMWSVGDVARVESWLVPVDELWHVRVHCVEAAYALESHEGAFPVPRWNRKFDAPEHQTAHEVTISHVNGEGARMRSGIVDAAGDRERLAGILEAAGLGELAQRGDWAERTPEVVAQNPMANIYDWEPSAVPALTVRLAPGTTWLACLVYGDPDVAEGVER